MKNLFVACLLLGLLAPGVSMAQYTYGSTGLLHAPTADMQKDKTFMAGGGFIDKYSTTKYFQSDEVGYTWNYYINITFFPWLEVAYVCTLKYADHGDGYFPEESWGSFCNQDRAFCIRLRLWKEGWWKSWTPQIVVGFDDALSHTSTGGGSTTVGGGSGSHNYMTRYYVAATKHFILGNIGELGAHVSLVIGDALEDLEYTRPAAGVNFQFDLKDDERFAAKALSGLNLMAEYYPIRYYGENGAETCAVNIGASYKIWRDHINLWCEDFDLSHFSFGLAFKVHLK